MRVVDVRVRRARSDDVEFLAQVVFDVTRDQGDDRLDANPDEFLLGLVEDAADQIAGNVPESSTYVIEASGARVGRLRLVHHQVAIEVAGLQIAVGAQGLGIGTIVLQRIQSDARAAGQSVWLEVEDRNSGADHLYRRLGFEPHGQARWAGYHRLRWNPHPEMTS